MSADGYVTDLSKAVIVEVRCYWCSRRLIGAPLDGHRTCLEQHEGERMPVSIEALNVED